MNCSRKLSFALVAVAGLAAGDMEGAEEG
ncbi:MAG: hypothetical protein RIS92_2590, partial [Verrucomicrobiota bacterium]